MAERENALLPDKPSKQDIANARKTSPKYMKIEFGYGLKLIVPHKEGIIIMAAVKDAEEYDFQSPRDGKDSYYVIKPLKHSNAPIAVTMNEEEYLEYKMSHLFKGEIHIN